MLKTVKDLENLALLTNEVIMKIKYISAEIDFFNDYWKYKSHFLNLEDGVIEILAIDSCDGSDKALMEISFKDFIESEEYIKRVKAEKEEKRIREHTAQLKYKEEREHLEYLRLKDKFEN